jgi:hypothetical protein
MHESFVYGMINDDILLLFPIIVLDNVKGSARIHLLVTLRQCKYLAKVNAGIAISRNGLMCC